MEHPRRQTTGYSLVRHQTGFTVLIYIIGCHMSAITTFCSHSTSPRLSGYPKWRWGIRLSSCMGPGKRNQQIILHFSGSRMLSYILFKWTFLWQAEWLGLIEAYCPCPCTWATGQEKQIYITQKLCLDSHW